MQKYIIMFYNTKIKESFCAPKPDKPFFKKQQHKNVSRNVQWTWFLNLERENNPRQIDMPLK